MSTGHHGDAENIKRFLDQIEGKAKRQYPQGRMGHKDDGALAYAVTADLRHKTVVIRFGKTVEWIGLGVDDAVQLAEKLQEKIRELRAEQLAQT